MRRKPLIASCTFARPKCRWVAPLLGEDRIDWEFFRIHTERPRWQDWMGLPLYQRPLAAWRCSRFVKRYKPDLLITQEPTVSHFCARFCRLARAPVDHVAFSFNFLSLPEGARRESMRRAFANVQTFVVYSKMEMMMYHNHFGIPLHRFDFVHWGVAEPNVTDASTPLMAGEYICALGVVNRDYGALLRVMQSLPLIRLVLAGNREVLRGLPIPKNVRVLCDLPFDDAMNILNFSRFMVLPLAGVNVPSGHRTMVSSMQVARAMVVTDSLGVRDYAFHESNALLVQHGSDAALREGIVRLWENRSEADRLGRRGRQFASEHCTEAHTVRYLIDTLERRKLLG